MSVTINGTGGLTFNDGSNQNTASKVGMVNRIINGDFRIDQRNAGASVTPTTTGYTLDRWRAGITVGSKFSVQQSSTAPNGFTKSALITSLSAYSVSSGDILSFQQFIEGNNTADLGWGTASAATVTLSFWVRSSLTGTFGGALSNNDANRSYPFTYTISAANTWEQKSITIAGDTSGTWETGNLIGIQIRLGLGVGTTFSGTAGSWSGSNFFSATGAVSVVGTSGATFYITGVQLEKGSTATSFDYRPYGTELALCQRYYYKNITSSDGSQRFQIDTYVTSGIFPLASLSHPVPMRSNPTKTKIGSWTGSNIDTSTVGFGGNDLVINIQADSNGTGRGYLYPLANEGWSASAEL